MKLERKWARLAMIMLLLALFSVVQTLLYHAWIVQVMSVFLTVIFAIAALVIMYVNLRCLSCGKTTCPPRWNPGRRFYCSRCGEPFIFDDEEDAR